MLISIVVSPPCSVSQAYSIIQIDQRGNETCSDILIHKLSFTKLSY